MSIHSCALLLFSTCLSPWHLQSGRSSLSKAVTFPVSHLVLSLFALLWPLWFPWCHHFCSHSSNKWTHCKTHQPGVCGVLLSPCTRHVGSTNEVKAMKVWSVRSGPRATSELCWTWVPFSSSDPTTAKDLFWKTPNALFLLIKSLKLKFRKSFNFPLVKLWA